MKAEIKKKIEELRKEYYEILDRGTELTNKVRKLPRCNDKECELYNKKKKMNCSVPDIYYFLFRCVDYKPEEKING